MKKTRKLVELCGFKFAVVYTAFYIGAGMKRFFTTLNSNEKAPQKARLRKGLKNNIRTRAGTNISNDPPRYATFLNLFSIRGFRSFPFLPVSTPPGSYWHIAIQAMTKEKGNVKRNTHTDFRKRLVSNPNR